MTGRKNEPRDDLERLTSSLAEDILQTSNDDIIAETREDLGDIDVVVDRAQELIEKAMIEAGKRRMERAKKSVREQKVEIRATQLPNERKRELLKQFSVQQSRSVEKITQAARNESELTENDLDAMLEALFQLGVIDEEGNPT